MIEALIALLERTERREAALRRAAHEALNYFERRQNRIASQREQTLAQRLRMALKEGN